MAVPVVMGVIRPVLLMVAMLGFNVVQLPPVTEEAKDVVLLFRQIF